MKQLTYILNGETYRLIEILPALVFAGIQLGVDVAVLEGSCGESLLVPVSDLEGKEA